MKKAKIFPSAKIAHFVHSGRASEAAIGLVESSERKRKSVVVLPGVYLASCMTETQLISDTIELGKDEPLTKPD